MKRGAPIPSSPSGWLEEIALAYCDAAEIIPVGRAIGARIRARDLFLVSPDVVLKFRGIKPTRALRTKATNAALASYMATTVANPEAPPTGQLAFAFCFLASHVGLDLIAVEKVDEAITFIERHRSRLARAIRKVRDIEPVALSPTRRSGRR